MMISETVQTWAPTVFYCVASVAALWAIWKSRHFRETHPFLSVAQTVFCKRISDDMLHLHVTATIHNPSKVKVEPQSGYCTLRGIRRTEEGMPKDISESGDPMEDISESRDWNGSGFLEPGETHRTFFNFVIPNHYTVIQSYVSIRNPYLGKDSESGWNDLVIVDPEENRR